MRNLMIAFLMMIGFTSVEAQISFEGKKMIIVDDEKRDIKEVDSKIFINADTTEIEVYSKVIKFKEPIKEFLTIFENGDYKIFVYVIENDNNLVIHVKNEKIISIIFQENVYNYLEFNI